MDKLEDLIRQAKEGNCPIVIISDSVLNRTNLRDLVPSSATYSEPGQHNINSDYRIIISEAEVDLLAPFKLSPKMLEVAQEITKGVSNPSAKAETLFKYVDKKIEYGDTKRSNGIRDSEEVFLTQEGICSELTILYVAMARSVGLKANYAHVDVDNVGDKVNHACAVVDLGMRDVLVDPAYHTFNIKHRDWYKLDDKRAIEYFRRFRKMKSTRKPKPVSKRVKDVSKNNTGQTERVKELKYVKFEDKDSIFASMELPEEYLKKKRKDSIFASMDDPDDE